MPVRPLLVTLTLSLAPATLLPAATAPTGKIDLLADPSFKDWVFHLSEKNSLTTRRDEVAVIKNGVLQVTGKGFGYFRTREAYRDYHLVMEYRWGEKTWSKRLERARDCGLLLHSHGPDGAFSGTWQSCIQAQMLEGSMGDINVLQGKDGEGNLITTRLTCEVEKTPGGYRWKKGGQPLTFPPAGKSAASIRWKDRDPGWKDEKGFRGARDVEKPAGAWNRMEVICEGGSYRILLNGTVVNEGSNAQPASGFIGVQNEWAECFMRRLELWPIGTFKEKVSQQTPSVLPPAQWSPADKRLASLRKTGHALTVLPIWPGDGSRPDDPTPALSESMPERGDNVLRITDVSKPTLHLWPAAEPNGRCVIILPGGGYNILAAQHEGSEIAEWLNGQGITAAILKYRVPRREGLQKHTVAIQDAQRAVRMIRSRADEFGIRRDQIGVLGFSAGGHLTMLTLHHADTKAYEPIDRHDQASARPDFLLPIYPAYLTETRESTAIDPLLRRVPPATRFPPLFTTVAADDPFAPGLLCYLLSLQEKEVRYEVHIFPGGGHGKGLRPTGYPFSEWTKPCERWLKDL